MSVSVATASGMSEGFTSGTKPSGALSVRELEPGAALA
jgi:hypothetical protein